MRTDPTPDDRADLAERVLLAVELIPVGRVASYGDVGGLVGCGPRHVGNVLSRSGAGVPWWRVVNATGGSPLLDRALPFWRAEGIELKPNGRGCRMSAYRCDLVALAAAFDRTVGDSPRIVEPAEALAPSKRPSPIRQRALRTSGQRWPGKPSWRETS